MRYLIGFFAFWYDFIVGDDWKIAAGVALVLALDGAVVGYTDASNTVVTLVGAAGIAAVVMGSLVWSALKRPRG